MLGTLIRHSSWCSTFYWMERWLWRGDMWWIFSKIFYSMPRFSTHSACRFFSVKILFQLQLWICLKILKTLESIQDIWIDTILFYSYDHLETCVKLVMPLLCSKDCEAVSKVNITFHKHNANGFKQINKYFTLSIKTSFRWTKQKLWMEISGRTILNGLKHVQLPWFTDIWPVTVILYGERCTFCCL